MCDEKLACSTCRLRKDTRPQACLLYRQNGEEGVYNEKLACRTSRMTVKGAPRPLMER